MKCSKYGYQVLWLKPIFRYFITRNDECCIAHYALRKSPFDVLDEMIKTWSLSRCQFIIYCNGYEVFRYDNTGYYRNKPMEKYNHDNMKLVSFPPKKHLDGIPESVILHTERYEVEPAPNKNL
jgi:hypothetical protein